MSEGVIVAIIVSVLGPTVVALLNRHEVRRRIGDMNDRIGEPNGSGNVVQMLETVIAGQTTQDVRLSGLESRTAAVEQRVGQVEHRLDQMDEMDTLGRQGRRDRRTV